LIESKIQSLGVGAHFQVLHDRIVTPGDGLIIFQGMQDSTAESIKSLEGFDIAWVEEAQTLSARDCSDCFHRARNVDCSPNHVMVARISGIALAGCGTKRDGPGRREAARHHSA
jgi:phage terminase large subunit